jgi:hypothetical protein
MRYTQLRKRYTTFAGAFSTMLAANLTGIVAGLLLAAAPESDSAPAPSVQRDKQALAAVQTYVGQWRGVGQPRRGSNLGAWTEQSQWAWRFQEGRAELVATLDGNKYFRSLSLQAGDEPSKFVASAATPETAGDKKSARHVFSGTLRGGVLTLVAETPQPDLPSRITIRLVAGGDRMVVLYEKQVGEGNYARLAESGSTRQGSDFAKTAASGPECIVTGGLGTIALEFEGKKYFVCCGGCREYFEEDPARAIAEYRERKAAEKIGP